MLKDNRQGWLIVGVLFIAVAFVFGGTMATPGVFFAPLIKEFGWSHAQVSSLASAVTLGTIPGGLIAGFLLERVDARIPIVAGAGLTAGALLFASRTYSYLPLLIVYFFAGFGVALATLLPAALVVAKWFQAKRGVATGVVIAGVSVGGMLLVQVATVFIRFDGWRAGYTALAVPIFLIVIPLVILVVRNRPINISSWASSSCAASADGQRALDHEGFNFKQAIGTRSFWLIALASFLFGFSAYGILTQLVVYLISVGYRPAAAAMALSLILGLNAPGKIFFGVVVDRVGARLSLVLSFMSTACGIILLLASHGTAGLMTFLLIYGLAWGAPLMLLPLITMESMGLKHYAWLGGILQVGHSMGSMMGPVVLGRIFDVARSYRPAFMLCVVCLDIGAASIFACQTFASGAAQTEKTLAVMSTGE
ncbi:MAG: MFS transporter [Deltaproteobacteria bacterium]|nr:MFS transporter [Deltaproteobacteria bacterium]